MALIKHVIETNKDTFERFWLGEDVGYYPLSFFWGLRSKPDITTREQIDSDELDYEIQLAGVERLAELLPSLEGVYVPCIKPYFGITVLADGFGAQIEHPEWDCPWVRHRPISTLEEAAELTVDSFLSSEIVEKVLRRLKYMVERAPEHVTVKCTDLQGPLNNAGLILDFEKIAIGMYESPELVHKFIGTIADAQIKLCELQRAIVEEAGRPFCPDWDMVWYPRSRNGYIAADDSLLMSPAMYKEFIAPYDEKVLNSISGGGIMHNCGPIASSIEPFLSIKNCIAVTFDMAINWQDLPKICEKLGSGGRFFTCSLIPGKTLIETLQYVNSIVRDYGVGYSFFCGFGDARDVKETYEFWLAECRTKC